VELTLYFLITTEPQQEICHGSEVTDFVRFCHFDHREKSPGCCTGRFSTSLRNDSLFSKTSNNLLRIGGTHIIFPDNHRPSAGNLSCSEVTDFVRFCHFDRREKSPGCCTGRFFTSLRNDSIFPGSGNKFAKVVDDELFQRFCSYWMIQQLKRRITKT